MRLEACLQMHSINSPRTPLKEFVFAWLLSSDFIVIVAFKEINSEELTSTLEFVLVSYFLHN